MYLLFVVGISRDVIVNYHIQGRYGTRSTIALSVNMSGDVSFYEKYVEDGTWKEHTVNYRIKMVNKYAKKAVDSPCLTMANSLKLMI